MFAALGAWADAINAYLLIGMFLALALLEALRPGREQRLSLGVRWTTNLGLQAINSVLAVVVAPAIAAGMLLCLAGIAWQPAGALEPYVGEAPTLLLGILVLDLYTYWVHRLQHAVFPLWRLHAVHHSDAELDASTGFRHHPFEMLLVMGGSLLVFAALGLPGWAYPVYGALVIVASLTQHANATLPPSIDRVLRTVVVTPAMHEVHHSLDELDHDSNYGTIFSFWDRLFGTYRHAPELGAGLVSFGVAPFTSAAYAAPHWGLLLPIKIQRQSNACAAKEFGVNSCRLMPRER